MTAMAIRTPFQLNTISTPASKDLKQDQPGGDRRHHQW
jgi:hypothetical protein